MSFDSKDTIKKSGYTPVIQWNMQGVTSPIATKNKIELFNFENKNNDGLVIEQTSKKKSEPTKQSKTNTLQQRIIKIEQELKKAEKSNGLLGKAWSWFKNKTDSFLPVDSSNNVRKQLKIEKQKIKDIQKPEVFKELTGVEYSDENYKKLLNGEIKLLSEQKLEGYKEGQDMVVDVVADVGAGIAAGVALATAPVTGGASLLLAAGVGGVTKLGIKATSAGIRGKDYSGKDILKDLGTGAITGLLTPVTMGVGGAVGNLSTRVGARVFGQSAAGKIATKATTFLFREGSIGAIFGGGAEGLGEVGRQGYHAVADGESFDFGTIYEKTKEGAFGGAVAGVLMSGGMKGVSKGTKYGKTKFREYTKDSYEKLLKKFNLTVEDVNWTTFSGKISEESIKYKEKLIQLSKDDPELATAICNSAGEISNWDVKFLNEIVKAEKMDRKLTLKLLNAKEKVSIRERLKGKKGCPLYRDQKVILKIVELAQQKPEAAKYVLQNVKSSYDAPSIPIAIKIAEHDKELAKYFIDSDLIHSLGEGIEQALNIDAPMTINLLREFQRNCSKNGYSMSYNTFLSCLDDVVSLSKNHPELITEIRNGLKNEENSLNKLGDIVNEITIFGINSVNKKVSELSIVAKQKLLNRLISNRMNINDMLSHETKMGSQIKSKLLPFLPKNKAEYNAIVKELKAELFNSQIKVDEQLSRQLNKDLDNLIASKDFTKNIISLVKNSFSEYPVSVDAVKKILEKKSAEISKLSPKDQKLLIFSVIVDSIKMENKEKLKSLGLFEKQIQDIATKFGFPDFEIQKILRIVESSNLIAEFMSKNKDFNFAHPWYKTNDRHVGFEKAAFLLKEGNTFDLAKILYSAKEPDGLTRYFDKMLKKRIFEMKADDILLPQTSPEEYLKSAHSEIVTSSTGKQYNVNIVYADDIPDLYAFAHCTDGLVHRGSNRGSASAYNKMDIIANDTKNTISTTYISNSSICSPETGFIFQVSNDGVLAAYGHDMGTTSRDIGWALQEFFGKNAHSYKQEYRKMVSKNLKEIMGIDDDTYIRKLDVLKEKLAGRVPTIKLIQEIDSEFANAYKKFLSINQNQVLDPMQRLMSNDDVERLCWNETVVHKFKPFAMYVHDKSLLNDALLEKAQEDGLFVLVLKR